MSFRKAHGNAKNNAQRSRIATGKCFNGMHILAKKNPSLDHAMRSGCKDQVSFKCIAGKAPEYSLAVSLQEKSLGRF